MKYSIAEITFNAKTNWEAQLNAEKIMQENGIKEAKLIGHFKNKDCVIANIKFPEPV